MSHCELYNRTVCRCNFARFCYYQRTERNKIRKKKQFIAAILPEMRITIVQVTLAFIFTCSLYATVWYNKSIKIFNNQIAELAAAKNTAVSNVKIVDLFSGVHPVTDMYDDIHPNDTGEKNMAESWYKAINKYLKKINIDKNINL